MPELPEVQTVVNSLLPHVVGARIVEVQTIRPDFIAPHNTDLAALLTGQTVASVHRRAKRIIFTLGNQKRFLIHLGMTGRVLLQPPGTPRALHTHVVLTIAPPGSNPVEIRLCDPRRFGELRWLGDTTGEDGLGCEPLTLHSRTLVNLLSSSRRPIKSFLLDQTAIAGLGNIYADESLFAAGLHPLTPCKGITPAQAAGLCRAIKAVLRKALRHRGSTLRDYVDAAGGKGAFQKLHHVYNRAGEPCRHCRTRIQRIVLAGRSTCFCPKCQPPARS